MMPVLSSCVVEDDTERVALTTFYRANTVPDFDSVVAARTLFGSFMDGENDPHDP